MTETLADDISATLRRHLADRYHVLREIGSGGMARVYLADDLRHGRRVALKVLNPELGVLLGVERFLSEIKVTAALQHPNLLPLFDSGEAGGLLFYVMPYIEGGSLRERLQRERQLPIDDAVRTAVSIANALHYAHRQGVVHRDLKPENILMHDGQPVLADFGIALAVSRAGGERFTQTGHSLGTPQYCSPEQAAGDLAIDGRSDIFALAVILYEMLAGETPHYAGTLQAVIARVLAEPARDVRSIRPLCPDHVALAIDCALQKIPADRFSSAAEFADALLGRDQGRMRSTLSSQYPVPVITPKVSRTRNVVMYASLAIAVGSLSLAAVAWSSAGDTENHRSAVRFALDIEDDELANTGAVGVPFAISPDGSQIVYSSAREDGTSQLRLRPANSTIARDIPGTNDARHPTFSPDGRSVAFVGDHSIKRVDLGSGTPTTLTTLKDTVYGLAWSTSGVVAGRPRSGLLLVPVDSGPVRELTVVDSASGERSHRWPVMLNDGKTVLFTVWRGQRSSATIAALTLDDGQIRRLDVKASAALGMIDHHLVVVDSLARILAIPFDLAASRATSAPLLGEQSSLSIPGAPKAALSHNGTLVLFQEGAQPAELVFVDTTGRMRRLFAQERERFRDPRFSPDGRQLAVTVTGDSAADVMLVDVASGSRERLSTQLGNKQRPEWTRDGRSVLFQISGSRGSEIWQRPSDKSRPAELVLPSANDAAEAIPVPNGRGLVYRTDSESRFGLHLWWLDTIARVRPMAIASGQQPSVAPSGRWLAYTSREEGSFEVFLARLPVEGAPLRCQVSDGGGTQPAWSADGRTLYYRHGAELVQARLVEATGCPSVLRRTVFTLPMLADEYHRQFDVAPDGTGFVMLREYRHESGTSIVLNWIFDLQERALRQP